jgi:hypothetical protein
LLDRFETYLRQNLPGLYAELNDFLDRAGIETAQPAIVTSPDSPANRPRAARQLSNNALQALQQALLANLPAQAAGARRWPAAARRPTCSASPPSNN